MIYSPLLRQYDKGNLPFNGRNYAVIFACPKGQCLDDCAFYVETELADLPFTIHIVDCSDEYTNRQELRVRFKSIPLTKDTFISLVSFCRGYRKAMNMRCQKREAVKPPDEELARSGKE